MTTARFEIRSPRPNWTGEGAGQVYFRDGVAELAVDLDSWEPASNKGALSYYRMQGFGIEPLDGVSVEQAMRDPAQEALAVAAEIADLDRQIAAETSRDDLVAKRQELADLRAKRAKEDAAARKGDAGQGGEEGDNSQPFRTEVPPPAQDASVSDWRAYAVEIDPTLDDKAAKSMDKPTLVQRYGSAYAPQEGQATA